MKSPLNGLLILAAANLLLAQSPTDRSSANQTNLSPTIVSSSSPTTLLAEANTAYLKGDFDAAIQKYQSVLQGNANRGDAYAGLTRVYLKKKDVEQANKTIQEGLQNADSPPVHVALGEVYFRQGKIAEAEKEWVQVLNSGHAEARAYLGIALVSSVIAMHKRAKAMIEKAYELDSKDPEIQGFWMGSQKMADRIKFLQGYLSHETNDDARTRSYMQYHLDYLLARQKTPRGKCRLVSGTKSTETKLVRLMLNPTLLRGYGVEVMLNGQKTKLMLDTGASGLLVRNKLAEKAGLTRIADLPVAGIGDKGDRSGYIAWANSIRIGELEFQNCPVRVLEKGSVADEDGLIGADVFDDFLVDMDFPKETLKLSELPKRPGDTSSATTLVTENDDDDDAGGEAGDKADSAKQAPAASQGPFDRYIAPEMQSFTRFFRFGHLLLIPTKVGNTPAKLFLLDTGAFDNTISPAAAREVTKVEKDSRVTVKGISGSVKQVYSTGSVTLQFGRLKQGHTDMVSLDFTNLSDTAGTEISGTLGFAMLILLDIKIDYRDGLVDFAYTPQPGR